MNLIYPSARLIGSNMYLLLLLQPAAIVFRSQSLKTIPSLTYLSHHSSKSQTSADTRVAPSIHFSHICDVSSPRRVRGGIDVCSALGQTTPVQPLPILYSTWRYLIENVMENSSNGLWWHVTRHSIIIYCLLWGQNAEITGHRETDHTGLDN